jgi:hypothetical protein
MMRTDPSKFTDSTVHITGLFPGVYHPEKLDYGMVTLDFVPSFLQFTGFWLPAGVVSTVTCSRANVEGISLQIGAHTQNLLETPAPWKRWPMVTKVFEVTQFPVEIGSPFGGLVYISHSKVTRFKNKAIQFRFSNVTRAPLYRDDETWAATRSLGPPWTEIETKYVIFTAPSDLVRNHPTFRYTGRLFDTLTAELFLFMGIKNQRRFRVVFDNDLPKGGSICLNPLVLSYNSIEGILLMKGPTPDVFALLMMFAISLLPEGSFRPHVEAGIGALAAAHLFVKAWPKVSPSDFTFDHMSPLFVELYAIYQRIDKRVFPGILAKFCDPHLQHPSEPDDSAKMVVAELAAAMGKELPDLLEKMLHQVDTQLPEYHFDEADVG